MSGLEDRGDSEMERKIAHAGDTVIQATLPQQGSCKSWCEIQDPVLPPGWGMARKKQSGNTEEEWERRSLEESRRARLKSAEIVKTLVLTPRASKESAQFTQWPSPCGNFKTGMGKIHCAARKMSYCEAGERNPCAEGLGVPVRSLPFRYESQTWMGHWVFFLIQQFNSATDKSQRAKEKVFLNKS